MAHPAGQWVPIRVATLEGAKFLGVHDRVGSIAQGKEADLLIVRGDPSTNIQDLSNVSHVFANGKLHDPHALLSAVQGSRLALIDQPPDEGQRRLVCRPASRSVRPSSILFGVHQYHSPLEAQQVVRLLSQSPTRRR